MNKTDLPPIETLRKLLSYEPETGKMFWRERTPDIYSGTSLEFWNSRWAGSEAFISTDGRGYKTGSIYNKPHKAHRVVWALYYGEWPYDDVDHINHDKHDNRIENLRVVTHRENTKNRTIPKSNTSGFVGVVWCKGRGKWRAQIMVDGRSISLGRFVNKCDAIRARKTANIKYGFHENHGAKS